jgi:predicted DNA-binding transcriptional regulator YafY
MATGAARERVIQPFAVAYYTGATLICAWCELRNDLRHFRTDRVVSAAMCSTRHSQSLTR